MASAYFRQFAIDHHLTVDYGYMYGKYKDFYITLKETLGSTKILTLLTKLGDNPENLKRVLSAFDEEELPKYCITDFKKDDKHIEFTFELNNDKCGLIVEFLDTFINTFHTIGLVNEIICPICGKAIEENEEVVTVDMGGLLTPMHNACYLKGIEEQKQKEIERKEKEKTGEKTYKGLTGAILYGLIYIAILIVSFFFVQFILGNADEDDTFVVILQYLPTLCALSGAPLVCLGYDKFKGTKGTSKYLTVLWTVIISTLIGTVFGFIASLLLVTSDYSFIELVELVGDLISCKEISGTTSFRWGFYLYIVISLGFSILSMAFKFSGKQEMAEANKNTFEKLD